MPIKENKPLYKTAKTNNRYESLVRKVQAESKTNKNVIASALTSVVSARGSPSSVSESAPKNINNTNKDRLPPIVLIDVLKI